MPIANCIVKNCLEKNNTDLIATWSENSDITPEEMTVNINYSDEQLGKAYDVMAMLYLPSLWSQERIKSIEEGLAIALAKTFDLSLGQVIVITQIISSGLVVESGEVQSW